MNSQGDLRQSLDPSDDAAGDPREPYIPLMGMTDHGPGNEVSESPITSVDRTLKVQLYTSHFLSTWNSRLFEFAAILFLASIFPGTLLPMSVYALVRSAAAVVFAQSIGSWIDRGNALSVVRVSIVGQRVAVVVSCVILWILKMRSTNTGMTWALFTALVLLACIEKLCSIMNLISVERDWVGPFRTLICQLELTLVGRRDY